MLIGVRNKAFEYTPGKIITQSDYAQQFSFEPKGQLKNEVLDKNCTFSMEACCLDRLRKTFNVRNLYDNGGGYVHQSNDTVQEFNLNLSDSNQQNYATTTAHLYTLLARMFEKKNYKRWNHVVSNRWMCKAV